MKKTRNDIQIYRVKMVLIWGWDLKKDFYELSETELTELGKMRKIFGYRGDNNLGRSKSRQFWYYLQNGYNKIMNQV